MSVVVRHWLECSEMLTVVTWSTHCTHFLLIFIDFLCNNYYYCCYCREVLVRSLWRGSRPLGGHGSV